MTEFDTILRRILSDIRVGIGAEFDENFERQAFFSHAWQRRRSPVRGEGHILLDTGELRRSIKAVSDENSITFSSDLPYAEIHNEGGKIAVTARMKRFFWAKFYETQNAFGRKKSGELRKDKRNAQLDSISEFYRTMACLPVGYQITIPRRRFLGTDPALEAQVTAIISNNLEEYFNKEFLKK
jgi:phage gpG-like protein